MTVDEQLLRPAQLAPLLGVTRSRVYQLIAEGAIPVVRVGGAIRIPRAAWEAWLRKQTDAALASLRACAPAAAGRPSPVQTGVVRTRRSSVAGRRVEGRDGDPAA